MALNIGATDVFSMGTGWQVQSASEGDNSSLAQAQGSNGDVIAEETYGQNLSKSATYKYTTESVDLWYDSSDTAGALYGACTGNLKNSILITSVNVVYGNSGDGLWPTVTIEGVNWDTQASTANDNLFFPTIDLPAGPGCPELLTNGDTTGENVAIAASYTISCEVAEVLDTDGDHATENTYNGNEELSLTHLGAPTLTTTGWQQTSTVDNDENTDYPTTETTLSNAVSRET